jgi:O-antigen/teichoic acid export membrane protein
MRPVNAVNGFLLNRHILLPRLTKAFWVLLDQGVFALSNFLTNILFARWLEPVEYGQFAMSFSGCLLFMGLHWASVLEPLLVQSAQTARTKRRGFLKSLVRGHAWLLAIIIIASVGIYIVSLSLQSGSTGLIVVGSLLGGFSLVALTTGRRICAVFVSAKASALIGIAYLVGTIASGALVHQIFALHWFDIWLITGGWSLVGACSTVWVTYRTCSGTDKFPLHDIIAFLRGFIGPGFLAAVCNWMRSDALYLVLGHVGGLAAVAETKAVLNLAAPLLQLNMAAHVTSVVSFSKDPERGSKKSIRQIVIGYGIVVTVMYPVLRLLSPGLVYLAYGNRFEDGAQLLPIYCVGLCLTTLDAIISSVFKAHRAIYRSYLSTFVSGAVAVAAAPFLVSQENSIVITYLLACSVGLIVALILRMRAVR